MIANIFKKFIRFWCARYKLYKRSKQSYSFLTKVSVAIVLGEQKYHEAKTLRNLTNFNSDV